MLPTRTDLKTLILKGADPIKVIQVKNVKEADYNALDEKKKALYELNEETGMYDIPDDIWSERVRSGAVAGVWPTTGGSSTAPIMDAYGVTDKIVLYDGQTGSEYKTAMDRFMEESGISYPEEPAADTGEILEVGHEEEDSIRKRFKRIYEEDHPGDTVKVINDTNCYQYNGASYWGLPDHMKGILANVDGIIEITSGKNTYRGIIECKTSRFNSKTTKLFKQGIVPYYYYIQLVIYMATLNLPFAYICLKTGMYKEDFTYIYVERNLDIEKIVLDAVDEFFTDVEDDNPPSVEGEPASKILEFYRKSFGPIKEDAPIVELPAEYADTALKLMDVNNRISELEASKKALEAQRIELLNTILPMVGEATYATVSLDKDTYYSLKFRNTDKALDEAALLAEDPDTYKHYVTKKDSFNKSLFKKEHPDLYAKYETFKYKKGGLTEAKKNFCQVDVKTKKAS